jgi:hypothetical protein
LRKEKFQVVRRTATLVLLATLVCCIHIKADIWPLVLTGDAIPGTANFRFTVVNAPVVNTSGTIAFHATFTDPATNLTGEGIFEIAGGQLIPVMMEGQPLPDVPGTFGGNAGSPSINSSGDIVFQVDTNAPPNHPVAGIFEFSNGAIHRVVDSSATVPGAPGSSFTFFSDVQINEQGQILFQANVAPNFGQVGPVESGIFLMSSSGLNAVVAGGNSSFLPYGFSINNRGGIAYLTNSSITVASGNSVTPIVNFPQPVPGTNYVTEGTIEAPVINDNGDVAYISDTFVCVGRGCTPRSNAVVRWRNGTLEKLVAAGDPVPGFGGAVFNSDFLNPRLNDSAAVFVSSTSQTGPNPGVALLGRYQLGNLSILASGNQYVDGIGTLDTISSPTFDPQQGPLVAFVAKAAAGAEFGIYEATAAPQYTLRFPHIADGGGGAMADGGRRSSLRIDQRLPRTQPSASITTTARR